MNSVSDLMMEIAIRNGKIQTLEEKLKMATELLQDINMFFEGYLGVPPSEMCAVIKETLVKLGVKNDTDD